MMRLFKIILLTIVVTATANAGVEPTSGRYIESNMDLSIKIIGGQLTNGGRVFDLTTYT